MLNDDTLRRFSLTAAAGLATLLIMLVGGAWLGLWDPYDMPSHVSPYATPSSSLRTFQIDQ